MITIVLMSTVHFDLQLAVCNAYMRIARMCPVHVWKPRVLIDVLLSSKPCLLVVKCIHVAVDVLGLDNILLEATKSSKESQPLSRAHSIYDSSVGMKRPGECMESSRIKRNKSATGELSSDTGYQFPFFISKEKDYADDMRHLLFSSIDAMRPVNVETSSLEPGTSLRALSLLCLVFCNYTTTKIYSSIFRQMWTWLPWIYKHVRWNMLLKVFLSYL